LALAELMRHDTAYRWMCRTQSTAHERDARLLAP
jgi:hypothetical protein